MKIRSHLLDPLFLIAISGAVFYGSLDIYFVSDNIAHIEKAYRNIFNLDFYYFRPLAIFSLFWDKIIWGADYSGYHFTNLLIHTLNTLVMYFLAGRFLQSRFFALSAAFLFLLHPIHSVPIFWISGRTDMICFLFYGTALMFFMVYYQGGKGKYRVFAVISFLFALLSKEMAASLPMVLISYVLIFDRAQWKKRIGKSLRLSSPYILILCFYLLLRFLFVEEAVFSNKDHGAVSLIQLIKNTAAYLGLLIIPGGHIQIADFLKANPAVFFILSTLALAGFVLSLFWIRKSKHLLFFTVFMLISLLPVLRLMMRWYLYIPSAGFCLALAYALYRLYQPGIIWRKLAYALATVVFFSYAFFVSREQNRWIAAGEVSREISYKITRVIAEQRPEKCFFLNVPAELEEAPVFMYGLQSFINFRLREEFNYPDSVKVIPVSFLSLSRREDLDKQIIGKNEAGEYVLSLEFSDSHFMFPLRSDIASKRTKVMEGLEIADTEFRSRVEKTNARGEAVKLTVAIPETQTPVIYYLNGKIYSNLSF